MINLFRNIKRQLILQADSIRTLAKIDETQSKRIDKLQEQIYNLSQRQQDLVEVLREKRVLPEKQTPEQMEIQ